MPAANSGGASEGGAYADATSYELAGGRDGNSRGRTATGNMREGSVLLLPTNRGAGVEVPFDKASQRAVLTKEPALVLRRSDPRADLFDPGSNLMGPR